MVLRSWCREPEGRRSTGRRTRPQAGHTAGARRLRMKTPVGRRRGRPPVNPSMGRRIPMNEPGTHKLTEALEGQIAPSPAEATAPSGPTPQEIAENTRLEQQARPEPVIDATG